MQRVAKPFRVYRFIAQAVQLVAFPSHVKQKLWQALQLTSPSAKKPSGQAFTQVRFPSIISSWPGGQEVQLVLLQEQVKQVGSHFKQ